MVPAAPRCVTHPARPAVERCPVCDRPRCGADVATYGATGCPACPVCPVVRPPGAAELLVRAGLAGYAVAMIGATFATQYARQRVFSLLAPALVGLALAWACGAATGSSARPRRPALLVAAAFAVLSAALAFALTPGGQNPLHPPGRVLPPYAAGVVGVLAWPLLFGPPRRRRKPAEDGQPELSVDL